MQILGLQKLTLLDFPEKVACTLFTGGCNFRCPFCHNASLVLRVKDALPIPEEEFFAFLKKRRGVLEGVCITGGEPTFAPDLREFILRVREMGFLVKLDTNGSRPAVLSSLLSEGLLDYVAMDIKNSRARYGETVGIIGFDTRPIEESASILLSSGVPFEFRTTVVRNFHNAASIREMGEWLPGDHKHFLQSFIDSGDLIGSGIDGYDKNTMEYLLNVLKEHVPNAALRG